MLPYPLSHIAFVAKAGGLRAVFLASWSLDPRAVTEQTAPAGRAAANRIKNFEFTRGQPRVTAGVVCFVMKGRKPKDDSTCFLSREWEYCSCAVDRGREKMPPLQYLCHLIGP